MINNHLPPISVSVEHGDGNKQYTNDGLISDSTELTRTLHHGTSVSCDPVQFFSLTTANQLTPALLKCASKIIVVYKNCHYIHTLW